MIGCWRTWKTSSANSIRTHNPLPAGPVSPGKLFEEAEVSSGVEDRVLARVEPCAPKFDGAENLHALAFSGYRDFRRASDAAPGSVERRVLAETGFVGEEERAVLRTGFFLRAGSMRRRHRSCAAASARAKTRRGRCTENPQP